jgi:Spy/CpxP family protein refolding chaperone
VNRSMWKAVGVLVAVFALGAVAGGAGVAAWEGEERISVARLGYGPRGERPLQAMTRRLDLTPEQRGAIRALMEKHAPRRRAIMQEMMGSCGQELQKEKALLDDEIRAVLTPEQRKRFDELSERQRERLWGPVARPHRGP